MLRKVARGGRDGLLWLLVLLLLLLLSVLYHLNSPLGHRVASRGLTDWVSSQIEGELEIGRIDYVGLDEIIVGDVVLRDPSGHPVIHGDTISLAIDYMALREGVLRFSHAHLTGGELELVDDGEGTPTFLNAFEPTDTSPTVGEPFHAIVDDVRLEGVTVFGEILGLEGLRIEGTNAHARMEFYETTEIRIYALSGDVVAPFPRRGRIENLVGVIYGDERGTEVTAQASMGEEQVHVALGYAPPPEQPEAEAELDLLIHARPVLGETLAELGFDWASILTGRTEGYVRLSGPPDALGVRGSLQTAGGPVSLSGALPSEGDITVRIHTEGLNLGPVLSGAPELTVRGDVRLTVPADGPEGETLLEADLEPFEYEGISVPSVSARATLLADGAVRIDTVETPYGGGQTSASGTVSPEGAIRLHIKGFIPQVARDPNIASAVPGLRSALRYDVWFERSADEVPRYDISGDAALTNLSYGSFAAARIPVRGRVFGDLAAPSLDLHLSPSELLVSGVPLGSGSLTLVGGPRRYVSVGELREVGRVIGFEIEADTSEGTTHVEAPVLRLAAGRARLTGALSGMTLHADGGIELGRTVLRGDQEEVRLSGTYHPRRPDDIVLEIVGLPVPHLSDFLDVPVDASGLLDLHLRLDGDLDGAPHAYLRAQLHEGRWLSVDPIEIEHAWAEFDPGNLAAAAEVRFGDRGTFVVKITGTPDEEQSDLWAALGESAYYVDISTRSMDLALLTDLFPDESRSMLTGALEGHAHIAGTLDTPTVDASFNVPTLGYEDWPPMSVSGDIRYDEQNLMMVRATARDAEGLLLELEGNMVLVLSSLLSDESSPSELLAYLPWQVSMRVPPRTVTVLPPSLRGTLPAGAEHLRVAIDGTLRGGGGWPLHGNLFSAVDWLGDMSGELCASESNPRGIVLAPLDGDHVQALVEGVLGDYRVLTMELGAEVDLLSLLAQGIEEYPEVTLAGDIRGAEMSSLPSICHFVRGPLDGDFEGRLFGESPYVRLNLDAIGVRARTLVRGVRSSAVVLRETEPSDVHLVVEATPDTIFGALNAEWWNGGMTSIEGHVPITWEGDPELPTVTEDAEIEGMALFRHTPLGAPLAWLSDVAGVEGLLDGELSARGPALDPAWYGSLALTDGRVELRSIGQRLREVEGTFIFDGREIELQRFHAADGNGEVSVSGQVGFQRLSPSYIRGLRATADDFPVRQEGSVMAELNGVAELNGCICARERSCVLSSEERECNSDTLFAEVTVERLDVALPDDGGRSSIGLAAHPDVYVSGEEHESELDVGVPFVWLIDVDAANRFWVRSVEQDFAAQVSAQLQVSMAGDDFKIRGDARLHRGNFSVFGKIFEVESGSMLFRNTEEVDPVVSLIATHTLRNRPGDTVGVEVSGTLSRPEVRFTTSIEGVSDQGEIIALLLTGDTRIDRATQSSSSNPQGAAAEATDFLAGVAFGVATLALREQFGEIIPTIRIEMGDEGFRSPIIRAGINADSLIPRALRDVVRGIYIEGYFTARRADGTEDSTRQSHDNGFLIELQFPRSIVGRSDYAPPTNWSLDITWEP
ncbi:MAG: translocation/assembly module TamB domain-containing protein [Myxococcales bacterium]|nr:translocation/assembly module TamB domain-containing protein [Myxococcales bacterium]